MSARSILTVSALVLALGGTTTLFAPNELARALDPAASPALAAAIQIAGSGLLGFAMLNWMSRRNRIGGIYGRPLALGNLLLFAAAALSLGKAVSNGSLPTSGYGLCAVLAGLAGAFAWLIFAHDPLRTAETGASQPD